MFRPTHVTRAVQRAYGIEHPIGDPFGGAAYGEFEKGGIGQIFKSVLPIVAGAAMIIGSGGLMTPMVIGGAMIAGGAMSGIGAITGNQTLSKIGGITSAVAGIAGLGYSAYSNWDTISNFFSEGVQSAETLSGAASGAEAVTNAGGGTEYAMFGGDTAPIAESVGSNLANTQTAAAYQGGGYNADQFAGELQNQINQVANAPVNMQTGNMYAGPITGTIDTSAGANAIANTSVGGGSGLSIPGSQSSGLTLGGSSGGLSAPTGSSLLTGATPEIASAGTGANILTGGVPSGSLVGGAAYGAVTPPPTDGGLLSSVGQFINKNPVASMMGLQAVSGLAEGASPKSQAEGEYLQALSQMKQAEIAFLEAQKAPETAANTAYLLEKAKEFDKTKQYEEEKRAAYNESIKALQTPQTQNLAQTMYGGAGLINQARA